LSGTLIASLIGLAATSQIHLSKGLQRLGIEGFSRRSRKGEAISRTSLRHIYIWSLILNNTAFLWVLVANLYAPPAVYTSMFGFGLVVLMLFSERVLKEKVGTTRHIGAIMVALGTLFLGIAGNRNSLSDGSVMSVIDMDLFLLIVGSFFVIMVPLLISLRLWVKKPAFLSVITGLITGVSGACDPLFKAIAQHYGGRSGFIPDSPVGWIIFTVSFLFGGVAMGLTQIGFAWGGAATLIVPVHNMAMILWPLLILSLTLPGYAVSLAHIPGLFCIAMGMLLLFKFKS
jgi:hypothetical protein